jgi:predicted double-glycine peptidase
MLVPFENLPEESKIWIYQSNRKFSDEEFSEIETALQSFLEGWEAHGVSLESSYQLKYNRFLIIAVDQDVQAATG